MRETAQLRAIVAAIAVTAFGGPLAAQSAPPAPQEPPRFEEQLEVVGVTPIHGVGLPIRKVPSNVQVFTVEQMRSSLTADIPALLAERAASVHASETQGGTFQPDLLFRGFAGSPLLGASEGIALYQDGVRVNDPFGDTINWDALPSMAVASISVLPGSNPMFGLNALGGALSVRTKDGFEFPGHRISLTTGSFGRHSVEAESGGYGPAFGYYVAGTLTDEAGWRDFSPSTVRRLFGDLAWRGAASSINVSVTAAANDLTGNGSAPALLLDDDRSAVFTHPDLTQHDVALATVRARRTLSSNWLLEGVAYLRRGVIDTFNGDAGDDDDDDDDELFDAVNNISHTRGHSGGVTGQATRTAPFRNRDNHLVAGAGVDLARTAFEFASELASLTPDRGTAGSGLFDDDQQVDLRTRAMTASAFVTDTWSVTTAVTVSASARVNASTVELRDRIGTDLNGDHAFWRINPGAGVTYQAHPRLNMFGSYSESSRVPTAVELTCADPDDPCRLPNAFVSDPPLKQVVARTWEAGLRGTGPKISWSVAAFTTGAADDIIFISSGRLRGEGHFDNVSRTRRRGVEASLDVAHDRLRAFATYTLQQATFDTDLVIASPNHPLAPSGDIIVERGDRLPGVPTHNGKLGIAATPIERLTAGFSARLQSGQHFRGDEGNLLSRMNGFAVATAFGRYELTRRLAITAQVQNVFNSHYSTFGVLGDASLLGEDATDPRFYSPGAPRAAWAGVEMRF